MSSSNQEQLDRIEDKVDFLIAHLIAGRVNPLGPFGGIPSHVSVPEPRLGAGFGYRLSKKKETES